MHPSYSGSGDERHFANVGKPLAATTKGKKRKHQDLSEDESKYDSVIFPIIFN
jgi:hypothetical protein